MKSVPLVDLQRAHDEKTRLALDSACRDHGFFLLTGHGADKVIDAMWQQSARFFASPRQQLLAIERTADKPLGYYDRELTKRKRDLKQVFDFARPLGKGHQHNQWPAGMPEFRQSLSDYYESMSVIAASVMELLHRTLGLQGEQLYGDADYSNARLNYYPVEDPLGKADRDNVTALGDMALHHHTDPGLVTLLVQDDTGGLQTQSTQDGWIDVPPQAGTIIVNLGDSVQAWSNDNYKAAVHRVIPMTKRARMSTPYFYHPSRDAVIEPHPQLADGNPHYRPFSWREYIQSRVDDNFSDLGEDDSQVSKYRI
ncbi:MAG: 2OG-Fe(II) oxygenase family protein [Halioglobus sp.]